MAYFKINGIDYSSIVSELNIEGEANYNAQMNAAGNTVVDYINTKRTIEVGIIPLTGAQMSALQSIINGFTVNISIRNPTSQELETIYCILPSNGVEYFTIQTGRVLFKEFKLTFQEL